MLVLTDSGALALIVALISGVAALIVNFSWGIEHDCGNRYCRHVRGRADETDGRGP